jgi:DNA-binding transcriptional LysR family regulator
MFEHIIKLIHGLAMDLNELRLSRHLTLRDLNVLMTVAKCGSMGKAALHLSVSQPAISKAIADLEHWLGVRLFDRTTHGVEPTIYARPLIEQGAIAFDGLKQAVRHVEFLAHPTAGELRIGSTIAIATGFISAVLDRLSRRYPDIVFHVLSGEASAIYRALEERSLDVAILPMLATSVGEHLDADVLYEEPLVVVAGTRSPWSRRRRIELAELANSAWTLPPLDSLYGAVVAEAFCAHGLEVPRATVFTSTTPLRNALLRSGRFLSIVQGSVIKFGARSSGLKVLPVDLPTTRRSIGVTTLKNRTRSPVTQLFIDCARQVAKPLVHRKAAATTG